MTTQLQLIIYYIISFSFESIVLLHQYFPQYVCAVPSMAVFCSSLTSCFPGMLLMYFLNDYEIVPVAPIITGITFVFTFHMRCISVVRLLLYDMYVSCHRHFFPVLLLNQR